MKANKIKTIFKLLAEDIAEVYGYLFAFYFVCLVLSFFSASWRLFFRWGWFHASIVFFGILSLFSEKGEKFLFDCFNFLFVKVLKRPRGLFRQFFLREFKNFLFQKARGLQKNDYYKLGFIAAILIFFLWKGINPVAFLILTYGLVSVFFILNNKVVNLLPLLFFFLALFLLLFKKEQIAKQMAIYSYEFFVIVAVTEVRRFVRSRHFSTV